MKFVNHQPVSPELASEKSETFRQLMTNEVIGYVNDRLCKGVHVIELDLRWAKEGGWISDVSEDLKFTFQDEGWEVFVKEFQGENGFIKLHFNKPCNE